MSVNDRPSVAMYCTVLTLLFSIVGLNVTSCSANIKGVNAMVGEALFVGWGQVVRGREQFALQVFQEAVSYYGKLQEEGQIERFEAYLLDPHGGDLGGFFLIHGERSSLDAVRSSAEFQRLLVRAGSVIDNLGLVGAYSGDALGEQMALFGEMAQELPQAT
ncbi:MAG TPA: hypothetical protein VEF89_11425 [Solirubrobacteraceae bacterium]|nr:hypothetical protein [Solirubrobacteraceae bacterium]